MTFDPAAPTHSSTVKWDRVLDLIEEFEALTGPELEVRLADLSAAGEPADVLRRVRLHFRMPMALQELPPQTLIGGQYRIVDCLGRGGMGVVYEAVLEMTGQTVALKMIHPELIRPEMQSRFLREMRMLGQLDHPGIVAIRHAGSHAFSSGGQVSEFFTMERIPGSGLHQYLRESGANLIEKLRIIRDVAMAVSYAHDRQVVHRDLKPGNMIIRSDGQVMIFDFGLAAAVFSRDVESFGPSIEGTPPYMAPEQAAGAQPAAAADIYSLGVILHEMLVGEPLYRLSPLASRTAVLQAALHPPPMRLGTASNLPPALEAILEKALAVNPDDRFASAAAFARAINRLLPAHLVREPPHSWHPAQGVAIPATDWVLEKKLGDGAHGDVWLATNRPEQGTSEGAWLPPPRVYKFCATEDAARTLRREQRVFQALRRAIESESAAAAAASESAPAPPAAGSEKPSPPGLVPLESWSLDDPPYYIAMRWIEGAVDLNQWMESALTEDQSSTGSLTPLLRDGEAPAITIVSSVANALQFASRNGIIHRDVSPANILVKMAPTSPGGVEAWLVDFGLSEIDPSLVRSVLAHSLMEPRHRIAGSPEYIAPEIKRGHPATTQSDIYSLGVVLYRLLRRDLTATLTEWRHHVIDPFIRSDLERCLADLPQDRFTSPGELAESLLNLPSRRAEAAEANRVRAEQAAAAERQVRLRERAAYKRGIRRTAAVATSVVALFATLTVIAVNLRRTANLARGRMALEQVSRIANGYPSSLRQQEGFKLLEIAAKDVNDPQALRSAAASLFSLTSLTPLLNESSGGNVRMPEIGANYPVTPEETARTLSPDGRTLAIARRMDDVSGVVDLLDISSGKRKLALTRDAFPWFPVVEPSLFSFSPDGSQVAVAGAATSKHVLIFATDTGRLNAYLYHGADPSALAWHPEGRLLATGSPDAQVRIWDLAGATDARQAASKSPDMALPPDLSAPALDFPLCQLSGHPSGITALAFRPDTGMLASLDNAGYLRFWNGFTRSGLVGLVPKSQAHLPVARLQVHQPSLALEHRLPPNEHPNEISFEGPVTSLQSASGGTLRFTLRESDFFQELFLASQLTHMDWHPREPMVCAINSIDIFWARTAPLSLKDALTGENAKSPVAVAFDPLMDAWSLPKADEFCQRRPREGEQQWSTPANQRFKLKAPTEGRGSQTLLAACPDGRTALYCGRGITFVRAGAPAATPPLVCQTSAGVITSFQWDATGRLLVAVFQWPDDTLRIESWSTDTSWPPQVTPHPVINVPGSHAIPGPAGSSLIVRSATHGIQLLDVKSRRSTIIDNTPTARQPLPMALSHDGRRLAAVVNQQSLQIIDVPTRQPVILLARPRSTQIKHVSWHPSGSQLAALTSDGYLQYWNFNRCIEWLKSHNLEF